MAVVHSDKHLCFAVFIALALNLVILSMLPRFFNSKPNKVHSTTLSIILTKSVSNELSIQEQSIQEQSIKEKVIKHSVHKNDIHDLETQIFDSQAEMDSDLADQHKIVVNIEPENIVEDSSQPQKYDFTTPKIDFNRIRPIDKYSGKLFNPKLREAIKNLHKNRLDDSGANGPIYTYTDNINTYYVRGETCVTLPKDSDRGVPWSLPYRCKWKKSDSEKMADKIHDKIKSNSKN